MQSSYSILTHLRVISTRKNTPYRTMHETNVWAKLFMKLHKFEYSSLWFRFWVFVTDNDEIFLEIARLYTNLIATLNLIWPRCETFEKASDHGKWMIMFHSSTTFLIREVESEHQWGKSLSTVESNFVHISKVPGFNFFTLNRCLLQQPKFVHKFTVKLIHR